MATARRTRFWLGIDGKLSGDAAAERMIAEKELRIALVCYGGVSLAVYMHGVTKELWKLVRSSEAHKSGRSPVDSGADDTEKVWQALLAEIGAQTNLSVMVDILAGASAGGLNAVLLANALAQGHSLEPLTDMWLEKADVDHLLDADARPRKSLLSRLGRIYKEPVAWFAGRHSASLAAVDEPDVRAEIAVKLSYFVRSRWFKPPFSGDGLTTMLDEAMGAMETAPCGPPLVPPTTPLSLFVTATDYWGMKAELTIHSPPVVVEREHRRLFTFESPPVARMRDIGLGPPPAGHPRRQPVGSRPALLLAARATASFPGAFPPASIGEIDRRLANTGRGWPDRSEFIARQLPDSRRPEDIALIDGSVLNNAPFAPTIAAVRSRYGHREIDRRFVYIDPTPDVDDQKDTLDGRQPSFFSTIFRSMADIPREQPIRESLAEISELSQRVGRLRSVINALPASVDEAILHAVGARLFRLPISPDRLARARSRIQSAAACDAGFAFGAYAQLKLQLVLDEAAGLVARATGLGPRQQDLLRQALGEAAAARDAFAHEAAIGKNAETSGYVRLLRQLDVGYRIRRLQFFLSRLSAAMTTSLTPAERRSAELLKASLRQAIAPFEHIRAGLTAEQAMRIDPIVQPLRRQGAPGDKAAIVEIGAGVIDALADMLGLSQLDVQVDEVLVDIARDVQVGSAARRDVIRSWLGYPFYDIVILPLIHDQYLHGFEELLVDRISPDDTQALMEGGSRGCLKGWQLSAFAAFFSRAYRENDYLWGRLNAAERLVDIVASAVPNIEIDAVHWKSRLFRAIVASESTRLGKVGKLLEGLIGRIENFENGIPNCPPAPAEE